MLGVVIDMGEEGPDTGNPLLPTNHHQETYKDILISPDLNFIQQEELAKLVRQFDKVFTDRPGKTNLVEHDIRLTDDTAVRQPMYPTPFALRETIEKEVRELLEMGLIEPSQSPFSSPVVMVRKAHGSNRFCVDFRKLNQVTKFDAEPLPNLDELLAQIAHDPTYFLSKIDLSKGYWQVPFASGAGEKTAFQTNCGHYQWRVMPFGTCDLLTWNEAPTSRHGGCR